ncbi:hypothetical protein Rcae01_02541 [Novipirellula caenicola]|uniref:Group II intron, maturase-specific domain n=1 Tax=Novipirellula caenicola TaxID=1536901 RepID=A0ABP9VPI5_9BACT
MRNKAAVFCGQFRVFQDCGRIERRSVHFRVAGIRIEQGKPARKLAQKLARKMQRWIGRSGASSIEKFLWRYNPVKMTWFDRFRVGQQKQSNRMTLLEHVGSFVVEFW